MVQNVPAVQETQVWSLGEGNGSPLQYSCLENSMHRGAWWATVHELEKSWTQMSVTNNFTLLDFKPHDRKFIIYHFLNSTSKGRKKKPTDFLTSVYADIGNLRHHKNLLEYSWPLKNMGLSFKGLLKCRFFPMVKTTVLFNLQLLTSSTHHCKHEGTLDKKSPL